LEEIDMTERHENQPRSHPADQPPYAPSAAPGSATTGTYRPGEAAPLADQGSTQMGNAGLSRPADQPEGALNRAREDRQQVVDQVKAKGSQAASAAEERA
jgi:hypothetical protein